MIPGTCQFDDSRAGYVVGDDYRMETLSGEFAAYTVEVCEEICCNHGEQCVASYVGLDGGKEDCIVLNHRKEDVPATKWVSDPLFTYKRRMGAGPPKFHTTTTTTTTSTTTTTTTTKGYAAAKYSTPKEKACPSGSPFAGTPPAGLSPLLGSDVWSAKVVFSFYEGHDPAALRKKADRAQLTKIFSDAISAALKEKMGGDGLAIPYVYESGLCYELWKITDPKKPQAQGKAGAPGTWKNVIMTLLNTTGGALNTTNGSSSSNGTSVLSREEFLQLSAALTEADRWELQQMMFMQQSSGAGEDHEYGTEGTNVWNLDGVELERIPYEFGDDLRRPSSIVDVSEPAGGGALSNDGSYNMRVKVPVEIRFLQCTPKRLAEAMNFISPTPSSSTPAAGDEPETDFLTNLKTKIQTAFNSVATIYGLHRVVIETLPIIAQGPPGRAAAPPPPSTSSTSDAEDAGTPSPTTPDYTPSPTIPETTTSTTTTTTTTTTEEPDQNPTPASDEDEDTTVTHPPSTITTTTTWQTTADTTVAPVAMPAAAASVLEHVGSGRR